jgi:hypothetical protein
MQTMFSNGFAGVWAGILLAGGASAHPGHAPTDAVAQISAPWAGPDHFVAFLALASVLLLAMRTLWKWKAGRATHPERPRRN